MRKLVGLAVTFALAACGGAFAQGPGSYAQQDRFGGVRLDTSFVAPDGCQAILQAGLGAPGAVGLAPQTVPVTVVVGPDPAGCSGRQVVRRVLNIGFVSHLNMLQIFFISPQGAVLKTERLSISPY